MYNVLIEKIKFYNNLLECEKVYGKPYTIRCLMKKFSVQKAQEIIQELYKLNWGNLKTQKEKQ